MARTRLVGIGLGIGLGVLALVAAASPATAEEIPVAGPTTYTVTGHGWGHGHGMSQYGALGAANQGLGWKQIVAFYYPGTRLGRAHGRIRVLISADKKDVVVDAADGLRLRPLEGRKSFLLDRVRPRATRWRILPKGERSIVSFRTAAGWARWTAFEGQAEFTAGGRPMTLRLPGRGSAS